jgi:thymidylate synthase (FAD)
MSELKLQLQNYQDKQPLFELVKSSVKFVACTVPQVAGEPQIQTMDQLIGYLARVSNPKNQANPNVAKLIKYCIDNAHWSILEQCSITVEITTSRDISAQIIRHKSFSFQEYSQRYSEVSQFQEIEARLQDPKNRQSSIELDTENNQTDIETAQWLQERYQLLLYLSMQIYREALDKGIAKEVARKLLPINASTTMYMTGSIRSFVH